MNPFPTSGRRSWHPRIMYMICFPGCPFCTSKSHASCLVTDLVPRIFAILVFFFLFILVRSVASREAVWVTVELVIPVEVLIGVICCVVVLGY